MNFKKNLYLLISCIISGCSNNSSYGNESIREELDLDNWFYEIEDSKLLMAPYLSELFISAVNNNFQLQTSLLDIKKGKINKRINDYDKNVQMNANIGTSHSKSLEHGGNSNNSYTTSVGVFYDFDFFGKKSVEDKLNLIEQELLFLDFLGLRNDVVTSLINEYVSISANKLRLNLHRRIKAIRIDALRIEKERFESGVSVNSEVIFSQRKLDYELKEIKKINEEIFDSVNKIENLIGRSEVVDPNEISELDIINLPEFKISDLPEIAGTHYNVLSSMLKIKSSSLKLEREELEWYPQISISGTIGTQGDKLLKLFENPAGALSSTIILPFIEWHKRAVNVDLLNVDLSISHLDYEYKVGSVVDNMNNALINLYSAQRDYEFSQVDLSATELTNYYSLSEYDYGFTSKYEYLLSEVELLNSKLAQVDAQHAFVNAKTNLCSALDYHGCF